MPSLSFGWSRSMATASCAYRSFIPNDRRPPIQVTGNTDSDYSASASQHRSLYSLAPDDSPIAQHNTSVLSSENTNVTSDHKPALPPKPIQGPPTYREPPTPPVHEEVVHPDICINSANPSHHRINDNGQYSQSPISNERPDRLASRTHAWVQEHKSSGKLVGEKLSSLQRKLRSFLSQSTSTKESTELEKPSTSIEEKPRVEAGGDNWNFHPALESTRRPRTYAASGYSMNPSTSDQQLNYISPSSFGGNSVALPISQPANHGHHYKTYQTERHPFAAPNLSEHEDSTDPDQMRDTCNKFFAREQRISWTNYLNPRNSYSNNIKSTYDYDKLVPKEVIGRPSQEKKPEVPANCEAICGSITPFPSFAKALEISPKPTEQSSRTADGAYYAKRIQNSTEDQPPANPPARPPSEATLPNEENETSTTEPLPASTPDCGDVTDMYKSSSESGRGTMHSSMHGSKSVVSPHSSGVSAASNLDTSIDSDHSTNGTIWGQQNRSCPEKRYPDEFQVNKVRHIYETPIASGSCRQTTGKELDDGTSESLSVTPPLPPLSPAPSPGSAENSPKLSSRAKYKLSLSASALNSYGKSSDHQQKCELVPSKPTSGKKSGVRRTTSINQTTCRHRSGKSSQYTKSLASSGHRLGIVHSNCASRKCNSSPPSRHHSRSQLAFPCYLDNADAELTSTTTGLDMESLLDDDDYSSDLSATASTMEPNEVNMIRKQLEGLETMYSEILRLLGVKNSAKANAFASSLDVSRHSRRKLNGSLSSLTARSSVSRSNHSFVDKRGFSEKRRTKESRTSSASKRLQRLESHVVTLARSVAHLSSEMRTQHILVQELENMRQDVTWVQERLRLMQLAQGCHPNNGAAKGHQLTMHRDWDNFHKEVLELLNPSRAKKLTKFFGDEPPLIRQFLKRLGYEKYATNFENEKIGIKELPYLTEERLQKMGVPMGPRIRILQEAQSSCPQNQYKVYIV